MTRLQYENQRLLDAYEMSKVGAVIQLYEKGVIESGEGTIRDDIQEILVLHLDMEWERAEYWLDYFQLK